MEVNTADAAVEEKKTESKHFIQHFIEEDMAQGRFEAVCTRFPPEPNGYLHVGHAKAICLDFGMAEQYGGGCNLRFDDTNPEKEDQEYVDAIKADIEWLGFHWQRMLFASDYFPQLYALAEELIRRGLAYVCDLSAEQIRAYRGSLTEPGQNSPYRERTVEENMELFHRMHDGEFEDGSHVLRAKIDMASPNLNMRDPVIYRIQHASHHRTGDTWCIYPMYDFAHPLSDAIEGISHSLCTLEFEDHRPLYDWFIQALDMPCKSRQIEFARLNLNYTITSKRKLKALVDQGVVAGWDDPRLPTLTGMRRRGYPAAALREFCASVGMAKANSVVDMAQLEHFVRADLNAHARRVMAVLDPLKITITNYPEGQTETFTAVNNPECEEDGTRPISFSRVVYIERSDFMEDPPKKFHRLSPGAEIRLQHAYYITCTDVIKDAEGNITELLCTYDPASRGGWNPDGHKVKGTAHWVDAATMVKAEVRLYDRLFLTENPGECAEGGSFLDNLNPASLTVTEAYVEAGLAAAQAGDSFQFLRQGYFVTDRDSNAERLVFNRIVSLKDSFKIQTGCKG